MVPVVHIASRKTPFGYLTINESDFDPSVHKLADPEAVEAHLRLLAMGSHVEAPSVAPGHVQAHRGLPEGFPELDSLEELTIPQLQELAEKHFGKQLTGRKAEILSELLDLVNEVQDKD